MGCEMTDCDQFRKAVERFIAENTRTAQAANECLVRIGTHLPDGTLAPEYGG